MDLEIKHLRLVSAIARTGSVTRAGDELNLSQSALSHQLRDIEERLATTLFHRVGKRMVLTTAGESVLRTATQVLEMVGRTEAEIRKGGNSQGGQQRRRPAADHHAVLHLLSLAARAVEGVPTSPPWC
jgi:LysR family transcriptional regulator for metE and metH